MSMPSHLPGHTLKANAVFANAASGGTGLASVTVESVGVVVVGISVGASVAVARGKECRRGLVGFIVSSRVPACVQAGVIL